MGYTIPMIHEKKYIIKLTANMEHFKQMLLIGNVYVERKKNGSEFYLKNFHSTTSLFYDFLLPCLEVETQEKWTMLSEKKKLIYFKGRNKYWRYCLLYSVEIKTERSSEALSLSLFRSVCGAIYTWMISNYIQIENLEVCIYISAARGAHSMLNKSQNWFRMHAKS